MSVQLLSNDGHGKVVPCSFRREAGPSFLHWPSVWIHATTTSLVKQKGHVTLSTPRGRSILTSATSQARHQPSRQEEAEAPHRQEESIHVTWTAMSLGAALLNREWWMDGNMVVWGNGDMPLVGRWRQSRRGVWSMKERRYWSSNSSHLDLSLSYRGQNAWI